MTEKVIFRKHPSGRIVAIFPRIPGNHQGSMCIAFMESGKYGQTDGDRLYAATIAATPKEYATMAKKLREKGWRLQIAETITGADHQILNHMAKHMWSKLLK